MRSISVATVPDGDVIATDELSAEVAEMVGAANNIARESFDAGIITRAKVELGVAGDLLVWGTSTLRGVAHLAGRAPQFEYPVPDDTGAPLVKTFTSGDGVLSISAKWHFQESTNTYAPMVWVGIRVDGALVAKSPLTDDVSVEDSGILLVTLPVPARQHTVALVYGVHSPTMPAATLNWLDRSVAIREAAR